MLFRLFQSIPSFNLITRARMGRANSLFSLLLKAVLLCWPFLTIEASSSSSRFLRSFSMKRQVHPRIKKAQKTKPQGLRSGSDDESSPKTLKVLSDQFRFTLNKLLSRPVPSVYLLTSGIVVAVGGKVLSAEPVRRAIFFWRHAGPIVAHYKFAQWWLESSQASQEKRDQVYDRLHNRYCGTSLHIMMHLKGLYVKLGQVLSSRPDFIPPQYIEIFSQGQDSVPQWPIEQVEDIIRDSLQSEFGLDFDEVFESIDPIALGSASIGQVHRAVVSDLCYNITGSQQYESNVVAVKVMHPWAKERFSCDFQVFRWLCRLALPGWKGFLDELERSMMTEFDYRNEATSLIEVRDNMACSPYRNRVYVPQPIENLCCKNVLVMEMLSGQTLVEDIEEKLTQVLGCTRQETAEFLLGYQRKEDMLSSSNDGEPLLGQLGLWNKAKIFSLKRKYRHYLELLLDVHGYQIFINGCFNGDPHPGNCLALDNDDKRLGLIDYGQTRRLGDTDRLALAQIVSALGKGSSSTTIAQAMRTLGFSVRDESDDMLAKYATIFFDSDLEGQLMGYPNPQEYFSSLMSSNPLTAIPDSAGKHSYVRYSSCMKDESHFLISLVFVARVSFLFRGMGTLIGADHTRTAKRWAEHANRALEIAQE